MSENTAKPTKGWFSERMEDPEFRRHYERESATEDFLGQIEDLLAALNISRSKLAELMGCKPSNITKIMRRSNNLKLSTMVDMAMALNRRLRLSIEEADAHSLVTRSQTWQPALVARPASASKSSVEPAPVGESDDAADGRLAA